MTFKKIFKVFTYPVLISTFLFSSSNCYLTKQKIPPGYVIKQDKQVEQLVEQKKYQLNQQPKTTEKTKKPKENLQELLKEYLVPKKSSDLEKQLKIQPLTPKEKKEYRGLFGIKGFTTGSKTADYILFMTALGLLGVAGKNIYDSLQQKGHDRAYGGGEGEGGPGGY